MQQKSIDVRAKRAPALVTSRGLRFSRGNQKLGQIGNFNLPAGDPAICVGMGRTEKSACSGCYASRLEKFRSNVRESYRSNYDIVTSLIAEPSALITELVAGVEATAGVLVDGSRAFRIHVAGDFFSLAYLRCWIAVAENLPDIRFLAFTHSIALIREFADLGGVFPQNFSLLLSQDDENCRQVGNLASRLDLPVAVAGQKGEKNEGHDILSCPEQTKGTPCTRCGACFRGYFGRSKRGVFFKFH